MDSDGFAARNLDYEALGLGAGDEMVGDSELGAPFGLTRGSSASYYRSMSTTLLREDHEPEVYRSIGAIQTRAAVIPNVDSWINYDANSHHFLHQKVYNSYKSVKPEIVMAEMEALSDIQVQPLTRSVSNSSLSPTHAFCDASVAQVVEALEASFQQAGVSHENFNSSLSCFECSKSCFRFDVYIESVSENETETHGKLLIEVQRLSSGGPCAGWGTFMEQLFRPLEPLCRRSGFFSPLQTRQNSSINTQSLALMLDMNEEMEDIVDEAVLDQEYTDLVNIIVESENFERKCEIAKLLADLSTSYDGSNALVRIGAFNKILKVIQQETLALNAFETYVGDLCSIVASLASIVVQGAELGANVALQVLSSFPHGGLVREPLRQAARALLEFSKYIKHEVELRTRIRETAAKRCANSRDSMLSSYLEEILHNLRC